MEKGESKNTIDDLIEGLQTVKAGYGNTEVQILLTDEEESSSFTIDTFVIADKDEGKILFLTSNINNDNNGTN